MNETIEDIMAEIREAEKTCTRSDIAQLPTQYLKEWSDRIEAALEREREHGAEAAQICGEVGEMIGRDAACHQSFTDCHGLVNAAKMREALSDACYAMHNFLKTKYNGYEEMAKALDKAKSALSKPPRNCDIYDADSCRTAYHLHGDGLMTMQAFVDWLFAQAEEGCAK